MTQIVINGTSQKDVISTSDLQSQYPYAGTYGNPNGFTVNGLDSDDTLYSYFINRNGVDRLNGGDGDDFFAVHAYESPLPSKNYATIYGSYGTDDLFILPGNYLTSPISNERNALSFTVQDDTGSTIVVSVSNTVESITFGGESEDFDDDIVYLTEDLSKGILRAVSWDEQNFRTSNNNADWALKGLETYSDYQEYNSGNKLQENDPITGSTLDFIDRNDPIDLSIGRLYTAAFGRLPEEKGFYFWRNAIRDPLIDYNTIADEFNWTPEYRERTDGQTTGAIITGLYENVLGRGPDQEGLNFWLEELVMGNISMNGLLPAFANSDENIERFNSLLG
jgi:hypothetical protein